MLRRNKPLGMFDIISFSFEIFELSLILKDVLWISLQDDVIDWSKIYFIGWKTMSYSSQKKWSALVKIIFLDFSQDCYFANHNEFS